MAVWWKSGPECRECIFVSLIDLSLHLCEDSTKNRLQPLSKSVHIFVCGSMYHFCNDLYAEYKWLKWIIPKFVFFYWKCRRRKLFEWSQTQKNNKHFLNMVCLSVEEKLNSPSWFLVTLYLEEFQTWMTNN